MNKFPSFLKKKILSNASLDHNLNTNCAPFSIKYAQTGTTLHSFIPYVFTADVFTGLENRSWEFPEPCEVLGAALASLGAVPVISCACSLLYCFLSRNGSRHLLDFHFTQPFPTSGNWQMKEGLLWNPSFGREFFKFADKLSA